MSIDTTIKHLCDRSAIYAALADWLSHNKHVGFVSVNGICDEVIKRVPDQEKVAIIFAMHDLFDWEFRVVFPDGSLSKGFKSPNEINLNDFPQGVDLISGVQFQESICPNWTKDLS
jgi:hypothetical protein